MVRFGDTSASFSNDPTILTVITESVPTYFVFGVVLHVPSIVPLTVPFSSPSSGLMTVRTTESHSTTVLDSCTGHSLTLVHYDSVTLLDFHEDLSFYVISFSGYPVVSVLFVICGGFLWGMSRSSGFGLGFKDSG